MNSWGSGFAVALCLGVAACGGGGHAAPAASSSMCNAAQAEPANLATVDPAAASFYPRVAAGCIVVDGRRLDNANVAITITSAHITETRTPVGLPNASSPAPLSSSGWLRWGAAAAVRLDLLEQAAQTDHVQMPQQQLDAAVANCKQASKKLHLASPCAAADFRRDYAVKAEEQRIRASGSTEQQWFAAQVPKHTIYVSGFDVTADELASVPLVPPGCTATVVC